MSIDRTAYNALIDDDGSDTVGTIWNKNQIKNVILDPVDAFVSKGGTWTPYTPSWIGGDGVGPILNDGTISGRYMQIGKWVDVSISMRTGPGTTYGTSSFWYWTLPFTPVVMNLAQETTFRGGIMSAGGAPSAPLIGRYINVGNGVYVTTGTGAFVNPTTPLTWIAYTLMSLRGSYEIP